jgi:hypothetical protein
VPFLWILPLTLYLLSFVLCFEGRNWYQRTIFFGPLLVIVGAMAWALHTDGGVMNIKEAIPLFAVGLFVMCMFFHGELAALKPAPRHLTGYYLMISLGGAIGGLLVGFVGGALVGAIWGMAQAWRDGLRIDWQFPPRYFGTTLVEYREFPLFGSIPSAINNLAAQVPLLVITATFMNEFAVLIHPDAAHIHRVRLGCRRLLRFRLGFRLRLDEILRQYLAQHQMRIGATEPEAGHPGDGVSAVARPIGSRLDHPKMDCVEVDIGVGPGIVDRCRNLVVAQ